MAVPVLTTLLFLERTWVGTTEGLLVAVQVRATELMPFHLPPAALEGEAEKASATIPPT
jgi:hypothetical protein